MNAAIDTWDGPAYVAPLDTSASMIFIGSDASEVSLGYDAIAPEILEGFARAREGGRSGAQYRHTGLLVGAAEDGRSAWWVQSMDYVFLQQGRPRQYPFRISGFAVREGDSLRVVLAHASLPLRDADLARLVRPAAADTAPRATPAPDDAELRALVDDLAERHARGDDAAPQALFADEPDVLLVGVGREALHAGGDAVAAALRAGENARVAGGEGGRFVCDTLAIRARGDHAWWYQAGRLRFGSGAEGEELPWRSTGAAVREDGRWRVLLLHDDLPVPNDSTAAFSEAAGG